MLEVLPQVPAVGERLRPLLGRKCGETPGDQAEEGVREEALAQLRREEVAEPDPLAGEPQVALEELLRGRVVGPGRAQRRGQLARGPGDDAAPERRVPADVAPLGALLELGDQVGQGGYPFAVCFNQCA